MFAYPGREEAPAAACGSPATFQWPTERPIEGETRAETAIADYRVDAAALKALKDRKYGEKAATWSPDHDSNLQAMDAGYNVVHPRTMPDEERWELREVAGVRSTRNLFGQKGAIPARPAMPNETMKAFLEWVTELDNRLGLTTTVVFINAPQAINLATCASTSQNADADVLRR